MMENIYNSDYSVRLATLQALGGDVTKCYNSVYDIDLAILEVIQGGGGGGMSYEEIKEKLATLGVDEIVFNKDGQTVTLDYDKVLQIGQGGGGKTYVLDDMSGDECAALYNELKSDNVDLTQYKICRKFNTSDDSKFTVATTIVQNVGNEVSFIFWTTTHNAGYGRQYLNIRLGNNGNWYTDRNLSIASTNDINDKFSRLELTIDENGNPINNPSNFRVLIEGAYSENRKTTNFIVKVNGYWGVYANDSSVSNARVIVDKTKTTSGLREFSIDVLTKDGLFNGIYVFGTDIFGDKQQDIKDFVGDQSYTKWWALKSWVKIGDSAAGSGDYVTVKSLDEITEPKVGMIANVIDWVDEDGTIHLGTGEWIWIDKEYEQYGGTQQDPFELVTINDWMPYNVWLDRLSREDVQKIHRHCWQRSKEGFNTTRYCKVRFVRAGGYVGMSESTCIVTWSGDAVMFVAPYACEGGSPTHTGVSFASVYRDGGVSYGYKMFNEIFKEHFTRDYLTQTTGNSTTKVMSQKAVTDAFIRSVKLTQAEYDALATKDDNVLYIITDAQ